MLNRSDAVVQSDSGLYDCGPSEAFVADNVSTRHQMQRTVVRAGLPASFRTVARGVQMVGCNITPVPRPLKTETGTLITDANMWECDAWRAYDTACGTVGQIACDGGDGSCVPPAEVCNGVDDDCNGRCDDGTPADCRVPLGAPMGQTDMLTPMMFGHLLKMVSELSPVSTSSLPESQSGHMTCASVQKPDGSYLLSSDNDCSIGRAPRRTIGFWSPSPLCNSQPLYRLYKADINNHFYTLSAAERDRSMNWVINRRASRDMFGAVHRVCPDRSRSSPQSFSCH